MQKYLVFFISIFVLISCSSHRPKEFYPDETKSKISESTKAETKIPEIDLKSLQSKLGMERAIDQLGFEEKRYGSDYFSTIYFRIQCRDSEGTVEYVSESDFTALSADLNWQISKTSGIVKTDDLGFGQIRLLSRDSVKNGRLIIKSNSDLLGLKVAEVQRFIVPIYWCKQI
jgi:hypothetical protein